jgi:hypothetical protein
VCESQQCSYHCKGAYYDVNGSESDGCEVLDEYDQYRDKASAMNLGTAGDCDSDVVGSAAIPSDYRLHVLAPKNRPDGTPKVFKVTITDGMCVVNADVAVDLTSLPATNSYKVRAEYTCANSAQTSTDEKTVSGGNTATLSPATDCGGDESGTMYVWVEKVQGSEHSADTFTVTVTP